MHLARFNEYYVEKLDRGGEAKNVLKYFQEKGRKLARERCAPYPTWELLNIKLNEGLTKLPKPIDKKNPERSYDYFSTLSSKLKAGANNEEKRCWAEEIVGSNVGQNVNDIISIMDQANRLTAEQLRYKVLVPDKCFKDIIEYPPYERDDYPTHDKSFQQMREYVNNALKRGYPVEAGVCISRNREGACISSHSTIIAGQRYTCNGSQCRLQFRIQNSYGQRWQELRDNGWVDAENFTNSMKDFSLGFTVITPQGQPLKPLLPAKHHGKSPVTANTPTKEYGKEKCYVLPD